MYLSKLNANQMIRCLNIETGLATADSVYEECEHALITRIKKTFSISKHKVDEICMAITQLYRMYTKFRRFVGA